MGKSWIPMGERGRHPADPTGEKFGDSHWPLPQPHEKGESMKYMLIDVTTVEETKIVKIGKLKSIQLLGQIEKLNGRTVIAPPVEGRGFSKLDRLPLQYLYWHLLQQTPPDDYSELLSRALAAVEAMPLDNTPHDELQATINRLTPTSAPMTTSDTGDAQKAPRQISE